MYKFLQIGTVLLYVLLTCFCFLLTLALSGIYISWFTFSAAMIGWTLFCFLSVYTLSPLNLFFHRHIRRPILEEEARLRDCFAEVLGSTGCQKKFRLRIAESDGPRAFACSTNIIAISRPLMDELTDDELKGVLAHELGHLISRDLMVSWAFGTASYLPRFVGYFYGILKWFIKIVWQSIRQTFLLFIIQVIIFLSLILAILLLLKPMQLMPVIAIVLFVLIFFLLNHIFRWLQLALSRQCEYRQDAYAHRLGFGAGLRDALKKLARMGQQPVNAYFILMHSTHPVIYNRIRRLEKLEGMRDKYE